MNDEHSARPRPDGDTPAGPQTPAPASTEQITPVEGAGEGEQAGSKDVSSLDADLEALLSGSESPELFSLRKFFNMC